MRSCLNNIRIFYNSYGFLAEGVGFEPTIRFPAYCFSRAAPSTTRTPLPDRGNYTLLETLRLRAFSCIFKHMNFVRKGALALLGSALAALLFATAFDFGILHVAGNPQPVKQVLTQSGIYNSVVGSALDQAQNSSDDTGQIALNNPLVKKAAEDSFNPQVVQQSSEKVIDGIYDWLNGKTVQPSFNVDLINTKQTFADKVGQAAQERAATLPACTTVPATTDPLSVTCLPRGVTPTQVGAQAKNDVINAKGFLENPAITASSFKGSDPGQSVFSGKLKNAPKQYQRVKKTPYILAGLTILAIVAIIFLSATRRLGIRRVGIILITTGVFMLVLAWAINKVAVHSVIPKMQLDNKVLQADVQKLATTLVHSINHNYVIFGLIYAFLGVLAIGGATWIGKNTVEAAPLAATTNSPKPQPKPKKPNKVQG
jgi:hypothetical protein